ncbi:hypothetical protein J1N35_022200 [Gossypium stocksii]|uniref:Uncharacterized protein n=1 Tax=Gossypium stocksii TaxID=47602 RepID=A0A9D3VH93_9ROSI|nr:hypothetical protein J1N35_022200 [Gossypium stocksii]
MAIRFLNIIGAISQTVGLMVMLDVHTDCSRKGRFERLVGCVNLTKALVAMVRINGHLQRAEYEALPNIFFKCGLYGHVADLCSVVKKTSSTVDSDCVSPIMEKTGLERKQWRPLDEMMGNHLHDLVELKSAMEGLVCDLERTSEKTLMEGGSQIVNECMVVEDTSSDHMAKCDDTGDSWLRLFVVSSISVRDLLVENHNESRSF